MGQYLQRCCLTDILLLFWKYHCNCGFMDVFWCCSSANTPRIQKILSVIFFPKQDNVHSKYVPKLVRLTILPHLYLSAEVSGYHHAMKLIIMYYIK